MATWREYIASSSNIRARSAIRQGKEGFRRIGKGSNAPLISGRHAHDRPGCGVSASADQHFEERPIALGQVHIRQEIRVGEGEGWGLV